MIGQWISSVPIVAFSIIAGALSDVFGRKPLMILPMIGDLIGTLFNIINYAFIDTLPLEFFYTDKIGSFFGGYAVYYLGVYSYGTTITKPKERAHRLARLDGMETIASMIGTILSPIIFKSLGYYGSYSFSCVFLALAIAYMIFFVEEPIKKEVAETDPLIKEKTVRPKDETFLEKLCHNVGKYWKKLKNFLKISIKIPLTGMKEVITRDRKSVLKFLIVLQFFCFGTYWLTLQIWNLFYLYMLLVFDGFTETDYAHFNVAMAVFNTFCLVVIMPIFSGKLQIHDALMLFVILIFEVVSSFITPFVSTLWQFYLAQGVGTIGYCKYAVVRSLMSKSIEKDEVGKVFSLLAIMASLAPVAGNPIFRQLYNKTLNDFPGAIFLLYGAILMVSAAINLYLYFKKQEFRTEPEEEEVLKEEAKEKMEESVNTESTF